MIASAARADLEENPSISSRGSPPAGIWRRKPTVIAALAIVAILLHLVLRFGFRATPGAYRIPLLATLAIGGPPLLYDLLRNLLKRKFGSDLLGGISIITSILLGEYLAGSIIVLMLSGGEALEGYALRSASSVLASLAKRMPSIARRERAAEMLDVALAEIAVGDTGGSSQSLGRIGRLDRQIVGAGCCRRTCDWRRVSRAHPHSVA